MEVEHWYRIGVVTPSVGVHGFATLFFLLLQDLGFGDASFCIRDPEVARVSNQWTAERFHDGTQLSASSAVDLVEALLREEGFWCRLESDNAHIHVGEGVVYIGLEHPLSTSDKSTRGLRVHRVEVSPYFIIRKRRHPYPLVDEVFWRRVRESIQSRGSTVVLCQWAGGPGGERWFILNSIDDVDVMVEKIVPRSILAMFPRRSVVDPKADGLDPLEWQGGKSLLFGNVRILKTRLNGIVCEATLVSDAAEMWQVLRDAGDRLVVVWPEGQDADELVLTVCADHDGVVRTSATFE